LCSNFFHQHHKCNECTGPNILLLRTRNSHLHKFVLWYKQQNCCNSLWWPSVCLS
jgi:hypothetical protein